MVSVALGECMGALSCVWGGGEGGVFKQFCVCACQFCVFLSVSPGGGAVGVVDGWIWVGYSVLMRTNIL